MTFFSRIAKELNNLRLSFLLLISGGYNAFIDLKKRKAVISSGLKELNEVKKKALQKRTDISDHLVPLFNESLNMKPKLIVELGVRGGESTFVLERVAKLCCSTLLSVDIEDCSGLSSYEKSFFVQEDDIAFARKFNNWCADHGVESKIDILFIDTSHLYEHTVLEIESWFPFLSKKSKVFFHDSNQKNVYFRKDGSMGIVWHNRNGVMPALEKYFNKLFDKDNDFVDIEKEWLIKHYANCSGFTILEKLRIC